jgi:predicted aldo/keto reductase-like oxidoreductase
MPPDLIDRSSTTQDGIMQNQVSTRRRFLMSGASVAGAAVCLSKSDSLSASETANVAVGPSEELSPAMSAEEIDKVLFDTPPTTRRGDMLFRQLGQTGAEVSLVGMGGFHIGKQKQEEESIRLIRDGIDRGITFMDNSWDYNKGQSEIRMGKALRDGYREKVFLMTKFDGRTKSAASAQINESLQRLQTDHVDLIQFHENIRMEDPDRFFADGGAREAVEEAKKAGKVRFIGFTGHKDPVVHLRMLDLAKAHEFHFDTLQMPINVMDNSFRSFQRQVLPLLVKQGIAALAMKTFGDHFVLDEVMRTKSVTPIELLHLSMTRPVAVVITGIDRQEILDQALEAVRTFKPLTPQEAKALIDRTKAAALTGIFEKFKTTTAFDSTAHNPQWLG